MSFSSLIPLRDPSSFQNSRVTIVGLGLMGGSLAMALKQQNICREVIGLVRREETIQAALAAKIVDGATLDPAEALPEADLVVFSTPVRTVIYQLGWWASFFKPGAIITDLGSTKEEIVRAMATLPAEIYPIGGHPMCGKERTGLEVAESTLYVGAPWILTPLERTPAEVVQLMSDLAEAVGAKPRILAADRHDKLVAAISHLPYALSATLVLAAQQAADDDAAVWEVIASGFKDTSRMAASDVTMMLDIWLTNQAAVGRMIALAQGCLAQLAEALAAGDEAALRTLLEQAAQKRRSLYQ